MKAHIMIGISASGKSTYVKEHATPGSVVVNNDSARRRFVGINPEDNLCIAVSCKFCVLFKDFCVLSDNKFVLIPNAMIMLLCFHVVFMFTK